MEIVETLSVDELLEHMDIRRGARPYLVINRAVGTFASFVERLRAADTLVADFDGTLHPGSQWKDIVDLLPPEIAQEDRARADAFFRNPNPTPREEFRLLFDSVDRIVRARLRNGAVLEAGLRGAAPRPGVETLVRSFAHVGIVSFGIADYIQGWCMQHRLRIDHIAALRLVRSAAGSAAGYDWQTAVVGSNKGSFAEAFCAKVGADPARVLALGDSPIDLSMMRPGNLGVLIVPPADEDTRRVHFRRAGLTLMWPQCAAVFVSDSLEPLNELRLAA